MSPDPRAATTPVPEALAEVIARIGPLDRSAMDLARNRLDRLTKPPGSLGRLEAIVIQLAGITAIARPEIARPAVVVFAADHGVTRRGVSPYPPDVTRQMIANFMTGGAAINVLARAAGADLVVVDVGVAGAPIQAVPASDHAVRFVDARVAAGTRDLSTEPAMTGPETLSAIAAGSRVADEMIAAGCDLLAVGEMGIGNTTASSAIVAALTGRPAVDVTGHGAGLDEAGVARKAKIVDEAIALHQLDPADPLGVVAAVGGLEIAALVGAILAAASARIPVVLDGFITGAAALVAARLAPALPARLIASHRSPEPGHTVVLDALGLDPLLALGLRLGEASGAALAIPLIASAARLAREMATFEEAGVANRD